ncbi:MAG TPA: PaaI family thioesterase [Burkholderiaceae bacterium]|nr:PaaI family thioesterase [Burkholderiaceae bacterium]
MENALDVAAAGRMLEELFAPWVQALGLRVEAIGGGEATLVLPFDPTLSRVGGIVCGQAMMAAADTAMVLAVSSQLGGFRPMTTVSLNTSFMRAAAGTDLRVTARVLKPGRSLMFGEVVLEDGEGRRVAHATTTYALV